MVEVLARLGGSLAGRGVVFLAAPVPFVVTAAVLAFACFCRGWVGRRTRACACQSSGMVRAWRAVFSLCEVDLPMYSVYFQLDPFVVVAVVVVPPYCRELRSPVRGIDPSGEGALLRASVKPHVGVFSVRWR